MATVKIDRLSFEPYIGTIDDCSTKESSVREWKEFLEKHRGEFDASRAEAFEQILSESSDDTMLSFEDETWGIGFIFSEKCGSASFLKSFLDVTTRGVPVVLTRDVLGTDFLADLYNLVGDIEVWFRAEVLGYSDVSYHCYKLTPEAWEPILTFAHNTRSEDAIDQVANIYCNLSEMIDSVTINDMGFDWERHDYYRSVHKYPIETLEIYSDDEITAEMLSDVFKKIWLGEGLALNDVCFKHRLSISIDELSSSYASKLERLCLVEGSAGITDEAMSLLKYVPNIERLELASSNLTDAGLSHLSGLISLKELNLYNCDITDSSLSHLSSLSSLERLIFRNSDEVLPGDVLPRISDEGLSHLSVIKSLKTLILDETSITDAGLSHLSGLASLEQLDLGKNSITDAGLSHLSGLTNLTSLSLQECEGLTDAGLSHLSGLTNLTELYLGGTSITDAGLSHLSGLTSLEILNLADTPITDAGLSHLSGLTSLERLLIWGISITDAGLSHLSGLTNLETLDLHYCDGVSESIREDPLAYLEGLRTRVEVDEDGTLDLRDGNVSDDLLVAYLAKIDPDSIKRLWLDNNPITDIGLSHLSSLQGLRGLTLTGTSITDAGLSHLSGLTSLTGLYLNECKGLTDAGLSHLSGLESLTELNLRECKGLTDAGLSHLSGLTSLTSLNLLGCKIEGEGLSHLSDPTSLKVLILNSNKRISDASLSHVSGLTGLKTLGIADTSVTDAGLVHLANMHLDVLAVFNNDITDVGLSHLSGQTGLEKLYLMNTSITDAGLSHLIGFRHLDDLRLNNCEGVSEWIREDPVGALRLLNPEQDLSDNEELSDDYLAAHIAKINQYAPGITTSLDLSNCMGITGAGLSHLSGLTSLMELYLVNCKGLTDAGLSHLSGLTSLMELNLHNCEGLTDAGLSHLSGLVSLTSLDLSNCKDVTDVGLSHLSGLTSLMELNLHNCEGLTDAGLSHLSGLINLETLDLDGCSSLTDAGLSHLSGLTSLTRLHLGSASLTYAGLPHLSGLTSLTKLRLNGGDSLTDAGLSHLSGLSSLTELDLSNCKDVTDAGLSHLSGLSSLTELYLLNCEGLTNAGLSHLSGLTNLETLDLEECEGISESIREDPLAYLEELRTRGEVEEDGSDEDVGDDEIKAEEKQTEVGVSSSEAESSESVVSLPHGTPALFYSCAEAIHRTGQGQATTLGEVMSWFGVASRTDEFVDRLLALLELTHLSTFPSVSTAAPDHPMELRLAAGVVANQYRIELEAPPVSTAPMATCSLERLSLSSDIPASLVSVGQSIHATGVGHATTLREVLSWFGAQRRGAKVVEQIEAAICAAKLSTFPDVASADIDSPMEIRLAAGIASGVYELSVEVSSSASAGSEEADDGEEDDSTETFDRSFWLGKASTESMEAMDFLASILGERVGECKLFYTKYRIHPCTVDRVCRLIYFSPQRKALMIQLKMPETAEWTQRFAISDLNGRYIEKQQSYRLNVSPDRIRQHSELWRSVLHGIWEGSIDGIEEEKEADGNLMSRIRGLFK